jgi:protein gp37
MSISYAPTSWNPAIGCEPVSEGCTNCWAMKLHNQRHKVNTEQAKIFSGLVEPPGRRHLRTSEGWPQWVARIGPPPGGWAARARKLDVRLPMPPQYDRPFNKVQLFPARLEEPLRWRKPRTVAVCFMGDLFHPDVPDGFIDRVFDAMGAADWHTYLLLTKRVERMRDYLQAASKRLGPDYDTGEVFPHVWLGVTAENQEQAAKRIPLLLSTPGKHFLSAEPLLGPVDIEEWLPCGDPQCDDEMNFLDWIVAGGESGPGHRPMDLQWAADVQAQCEAAGVPFYVKQIAASRPGQPSGVAALDEAKDLPWK